MMYKGGQKMIEKIGNVTLDYTFYPGEDLYSDGAVEEEIYSIVLKQPSSEYTRIIEESASWPILYHLSYMRHNIVEWIPFKKTDRVLEIGSGCGAITGILAEKCGQVTCVELSKKRSVINATRNNTCENVTIQVGNFKDIEKSLDTEYDYILLIGVFEYAVGYMGTDTPYEDFLRIMNKHMKQTGRMVIAIENKFGLKYWAGCKEDHLGTYFSGLENYEKENYVRTFTRGGLEKMFAEVGLNQYSFYYPYPDYKFPQSIYSDAYLPKQGELSQNLRNFDRERMQLFNEKNVFDTILKEELFPLYSNSYLVVIGKELPISYIKYSNERQRQFRIRTQMMKTDTGDCYVKKVPLSIEAREHVEKMEHSYKKLSKRYDKSDLEWNVCKKDEEGLCFEYVVGKTLEEILDEFVEKEDWDSCKKLLQEYMRRIKSASDLAVSDYDLIFSNILVEDEKWTVIDYEWTFERITPVSEQTYRACYYYKSTGGMRNNLKYELIKSIIGISDEEAKCIEEEDKEFQRYVLGGQMLLGELRNKIGYDAINPQDILSLSKDGGNKNRVQIYFDYGEGATEEESFFIQDAYRSATDIQISIKVPKGVKYVRVDPIMDSSMVEIVSTTWNNVPVSFCGRGQCITNGRKIKRKMYVFETTDPNINFDVSTLECTGNDTFSVSMHVSRMNVEMAKRFKKIYY